ncbi:hypothetical protein GGS23DRAFT_173522 [Durotheca rogersii]|uniref:uncharacterized protein n=1 Tax=Durotheca rogersii TaxID=419775 RepID=UPI00221EAD8E|nr:uncharacterized protein GGS23DRAFT_173522 [Durotheca rogersii]KAI5867366.1 hypothetical protein GGS23DRAFT_173522 [Durotheca rogersii]
MAFRRATMFPIASQTSLPIRYPRVRHSCHACAQWFSLVGIASSSSSARASVGRNAALPSLHTYRGRLPPQRTPRQLRATCKLHTRGTTTTTGRSGARHLSRRGQHPAGALAPTQRPASLRISNRKVVACARPARASKRGCVSARETGVDTGRVQDEARGLLMHVSMLCAQRPHSSRGGTQPSSRARAHARQGHCGQLWEWSRIAEDATRREAAERHWCLDSRCGCPAAAVYLRDFELISAFPALTIALTIRDKQPYLHTQQKRA